MRFECGGLCPAVAALEGGHGHRSGRTVVGVDLGQQCLNFGVGVEARSLLLQDQVAAHAAARKVLNPCRVLGAIRVRVEVPRAGIAHILQELDQEERLLPVVRAEAVVLVVATEVLVVQVNVEQLARIPRLCHAVHEVQARHVLVRHLRVHAHHLRMIEGGDETQHVTGGGQIDVSARLVGLGFQRELQVVALVSHVFAQEVQRLAETLARVQWVLGRVALCALAAAPEDVDLGPQLDAQVNGVHRLVQGVGAHLGVVGRERTILESRVTEQVGGRHRHDQAGVGQCLLEIGHDAVALGGRGVNGNQVVVVEVDAVRADLGQQVDDLHGREFGAHGRTERVGAGVADGPQAKGEFVFGFGEIVCHEKELLLLRMKSHVCADHLSDTLEHEGLAAAIG